MIAPFPLEGRTLPTVLQPKFEQFYRQSLRHVIGARLRARDMSDAYHSWAAENGAHPMTFSALRRQLELIGHRRVQSNGIHYADVAFASSVPDVADTLPNPFRGGSCASGGSDAPLADLLHKVDAALSALLDLRRGIEGMSDREAPHEAAQRLLGTLDR